MLHKQRQDVFTEVVDNVLTSKIWGIPVFLGIMVFTFFLTFTVGDWRCRYDYYILTEYTDIVPMLGFIGG